MLERRDPNAIDLSSLLSRHLTLKRPIVSANMDTITRAEMAIAVAEEDGCLRLWDPPTRKLLGSVYASAAGMWYGARAFSPDGELLAMADHQGQIRVWPWRRALREG